MLSRTSWYLESSSRKAETLNCSKPTFQEGHAVSAPETRMYGLTRCTVMAPDFSNSTFAMMQNDLDIQGGLNAMGQISTSMSKTGEPYPQSIGFELQSVYQYTGT